MIKSMNESWISKLENECSFIMSSYLTEIDILIKFITFFHTQESNVIDNILHNKITTPRSFIQNIKSFDAPSKQIYCYV